MQLGRIKKNIKTMLSYWYSDGFRHAKICFNSIVRLAVENSLEPDAPIHRMLDASCVFLHCVEKIIT